MRKYKKFFATIALILLATVIFCPTVQAFALVGGEGGATKNDKEESHGIFSGPWMNNDKMYWEVIDATGKNGKDENKTYLTDKQIWLLEFGERKESVGRGTVTVNSERALAILQALKELNDAWPALNKEDSSITDDGGNLFGDGRGLATKRMKEEVEFSIKILEEVPKFIKTGNTNSLTTVIDSLESIEYDDDAISVDLYEVLVELYDPNEELHKEYDEIKAGLSSNSGAQKNVEEAYNHLNEVAALGYNLENMGTIMNRFKSELLAIQKWFNEVYVNRDELLGTLSAIKSENNAGGTSSYAEEPEAVERGISALIRSLADGLGSILSDMGVTLTNVIYGRLKVGGGFNVSTNSFFMEFSDGNVYGIIGAFVYSILRGVFALGIVIAAMYFLAKASFSNSAKAIETMKSNLGYVIVAMLLMVAMPNIIDMVFKIKEVILYEVNAGFTGLLQGDNNSVTNDLMSMYATNARTDKTFLSAAEYLGVNFISIYFAFVYVAAACSATLMFAFFPFFVLVSFRDRKVLSTWFSFMLSIAATPIVDAVLLYIPIIAHYLGAPSFVQLIMCLSVIPTRGLVKKMLGLGSSIGAEALGVGAMMAAGKAMRTVASTGKDLIGGAASAAGAAAGDLANARTFSQLKTVQAGAEKIGGRASNVMSSLSVEANDRNSPISGGLSELASTGGMGGSRGITGIAGSTSMDGMSETDKYVQKSLDKMATIGNLESPLMRGMSSDRKAQVYRQRAVKNLVSGAAKTAGKVVGGTVGASVGMAASSFLGTDAMVTATSAGLGLGSLAGGAVSGAAVDAGWSATEGISQLGVYKGLKKEVGEMPSAGNEDYRTFYKEHDGSTMERMEFLNSEAGAGKIAEELNKYAGDEDSLKEGMLKYASIIGYGCKEKPGTGYVPMSSLAGRRYAETVRDIINRDGTRYENLSKTLQDTGFLKEYRDDVTDEKLVQLNSTENGFAVGAQFDRCYQYHKSKAEFEKSINEKKDDGSQLANDLGGKGEGDPAYQKDFATYLSDTANDRARAMFEASKGKEYVNKYLKDGKETAQYSKDFAEFKKTRHIYNDVTSPVRMGRGSNNVKAQAQKEIEAEAKEQAKKSAKLEERKAEETKREDPNQMHMVREREVSAKKKEMEYWTNMTSKIDAFKQKNDLDGIERLFDEEISNEPDAKRREQLKKYKEAMMACRQR